MRPAHILVLLLVALAGPARPQAVAARSTVAELAAQGRAPLSQEALSALIVGNTLRHAKIQGTQQLDMWYQENGQRIFWSAAANIGSRFEGWYRIRDGRRCELSGGGGEVCFTVHPAPADGRWYLCDAKGQCDWTFSVDRGNPLLIE